MGLLTTGYPPRLSVLVDNISHAVSNCSSMYEKRPVSCKVYPFAWVQPGLLLLYQCPMGREVTAELLKFAEMSGFKVEKAEPEKEAAAIGLDGKVITAAVVPYTLLRQYYKSICIL